MSEYASPATPSTGIQWADLHGRLLLIEPSAAETGITTAYGDADAVRADVVVLDGDRAGDEYPDTLIFPKVLCSQLRPRVGQKVLARLGQGAAKPGQSPPWTLTGATDDDQRAATAHLSRTSASNVPF